MKKEMVNEIISMLKSEIEELKENGFSREYSKLLLLHRTTLNNTSIYITNSVDKNIMLLLILGIDSLIKFQYDDNANNEIFISISEDIINVLTKYVIIQYGHGLSRDVLDVCKQ